MTRRAAIIRAQEIGKREVRLAHRLSDYFGGAILFAVKGAAGADHCHRWQRIGMTDRTLAEMGLVAPSDWMLRCGDFCYYHAAKARPEIDEFWLFNTDSQLEASDLTDALAEFEPRREDFLGIRHDTGALPSSPGADAMRGDAPFRAGAFALSRISAPAVDYLLSERRRFTNEWRNCGIGPDDYPGHEAFVMAAMRASRVYTAATDIRLRTQASASIAPTHFLAHTAPAPSSPCW